MKICWDYFPREYVMAQIQCKIRFNSLLLSYNFICKDILNLPSYFMVDIFLFSLACMMCDGEKNYNPHFMPPASCASAIATGAPYRENKTGILFGVWWHMTSSNAQETGAGRSLSSGLACSTALSPRQSRLYR